MTETLDTFNFVERLEQGLRQLIALSGGVVGLSNTGNDETDSIRELGYRIRSVVYDLEELVEQWQGRVPKE